MQSRAATHGNGIVYSYLLYSVPFLDKTLFVPLGLWSGEVLLLCIATSLIDETNEVIKPKSIIINLFKYDFIILSTVAKKQSSPSIMAG